MDYLRSWVGQWLGFTQLCDVSGTVSWPGEGDEAGQLQLWYFERRNEYCIKASKTAGDIMAV